ncbi:MAG TPA: hypothetical protein VG096_07415 [Bryobacteraceae bacterium]|jgi:hypothetical protein|nr:hypothetical protein [Bryobacteraceae bacterium]
MAGKDKVLVDVVAAGRKGGQARAKKLTAKQRTAIARKTAAARSERQGEMNERPAAMPRSLRKKLLKTEYLWNVLLVSLSLCSAT